MKDLQSTNRLFMVEPKVFYMNPETSSSNHYQKDDNSMTEDEILNAAIEEFVRFRDNLVESGIEVITFKGSDECPDHIFPNWFTTFSDSTYQIFPMLAENRRKEKTKAMKDFLNKSYELKADLSFMEKDNLFLESTSSMVFDRINRIVYLTLSPRANQELAEKWCAENNYQLVMFETESHTGSPIYHTDVLMYVGTTMIGICYEVIKPEYRDKVIEMTNKYHEVLEIKQDQLLDFCGNCLEVPNMDRKLQLVMSSRAFNAYTEEQMQFLNKHFDKIVHQDIPTIEKYGGGSARCMIAELF